MMNRWIYLLIALIGFACAEKSEKSEQYTRPDPSLFVQSPINIITSELVEAEHKIEANYRPSHEEILHLSYTIELEYDSGSYVSFDNAIYSCRQFHFHTPSEHLIDGITYPMELHLVHTQDDDSSRLDHYFVISVLFKMGMKNEFLQTFIDDIPEEVGLANDQQNKYYNISDLIDGELKDYYHYVGSLTTPPFTETVHWAVLSHIQEASPQQIARLNTLEGNNARHIQSVNGRRIEIIHPQ